MAKKQRATGGRSPASSVAMTQQEIATRLGVHVITIKRIEARALRKIRAAIEAEAAAAGVEVSEWLFVAQTRTEKQTGNVLAGLLRSMMAAEIDEE
jgi:hypothetical protein